MGARERELRVEESQEGLERLARDLDAWFERRKHEDVRGQHRTQLRCLRDVTTDMTTAVREQLAALSEHSATGAVYEACRELDRRALTIERVWAFFRDKWDQRDLPELAPVLGAADEVVWSCWAGPFRVAGKDVEPAPLPYVEPTYSAQALPKLRPPREVRTADQALRKLLANMPIPLTAIPPVCGPRPWWLIVLAHETGHHVAFDLIGEEGVAVLEDQLFAAAAHGAPDGTPDSRWRRWTHELFADAFAYATVGPSYSWALRNLQLTTTERMSVSDGGYPPPAVRSAFGEAVLDVLGMPNSDAEALGAEFADDEAIRRLFIELRPVAELLVTAPLGEPRKSLSDLCDCRPDRFGAGGEVDGWTHELLSARPPVVEATLEGARLATAGAVGAWRHLMDESDPELRASQRKTLAERTLAMVGGSREPSIRGAIEAPAPPKSLLQELTDDLLQLPMEES